MKKRSSVFIIKVLLLLPFVAFLLYFIFKLLSSSLPFFQMEGELIALTKLNYIESMITFPGVIPGTHFPLNVSTVERNFNIYYFNNYGLAALDNYNQVIPYSIDLKKFLLLKKALEYCYNKYDLKNKHSLKDFDVNKGVLPVEEMICIKLYGYSSFKKFGYYFEIKCKNGKAYKISFDKKNNICVNIPVLLVKNKKEREYCKLVFC